MKKIILIIYFIGGIIFTHQAQNLARRAFMGVQMAPITEQVKANLNLPEFKGVLVTGTFAQSTAEAAGLQKEDILLKIGDKEVNSTQEAIAQVREIALGKTVEFLIWRKGKKLVKKAIMKSLPQESYADFDFEYGEVKSVSGYLRTMLTKPKTKGKVPAVLFIQGVPCYSLDTPLDSNATEDKLMSYFTRKGFATMRVEKSGMGDSKGTPCAEIDLKTEADGYLQALLKLKSLDFVDTDNIFIVGHSMGGVMAPVIAKANNVRGIIVYGAITTNFMEYYSTSRRTVTQAFGMSPEDAENYIKLACDCAFRLVRDKQAPEEIVKQKPECAEHVGFLELRAKDFWYQLDELNLAAEWKQFEGKVLAVYGKADFISTKVEHQQLAETVNHFHAGNGTFLELENCDHGMSQAANFTEAFRIMNYGGAKFNPVVAEKMYDWMKSNLKDKS